MRVALEQTTTDSVACVAAPHQHQSPPPATRHSPQGAEPRHGEGGQRRPRIAALRHTAGCGLLPGPAPAPVCYIVCKEGVEKKGITSRRWRGEVGTQSQTLTQK